MILNQIVGLVWNAKRDDDGGVRSEGGRLIIQIIKQVFKSKGYLN
jgi:hypothetical protein